MNSSKVVLSDARTRLASMSPEQFAGLGGGAIAYVRAMTSDEVRRVFPGAPALETGLSLFALLGADGSPIALTDSREAAVANAWSQNLAMVSLH